MKFVGKKEEKKMREWAKGRGWDENLLWGDLGFYVSYFPLRIDKCQYNYLEITSTIVP